MKNLLILGAFAVFGLFGGYSLTALATNYQLAQATQSGENLNLSPVVESTGNLVPSGGGSCG